MDGFLFQRNGALTNSRYIEYSFFSLEVHILINHLDSLFFCFIILLLNFPIPADESLVWIFWIVNRDLWPRFEEAFTAAGAEFVEVEEDDGEAGTQ